MTDYRMVARHVAYWRGAIHHWSTVWPFVGTLTTANQGPAIAAIKTLEQAVGYKGRTGEAPGGLYEIALYDQATGGVPIDVATYFDPTTPGAWVDYASTGWGSVASACDSSLESALGVRWAAGLSSSGKPVYFRKWFHAIPSSLAVPGAVDVTSTSVTLLASALTTGLNTVGGLGAPMGRGSRLAATTPVINPFYENHQMPRGRRRKVAGASASGLPLRIDPSTGELVIA